MKETSLVAKASSSLMFPEGDKNNWGVRPGDACWVLMKGVASIGGQEHA